MSFYQINSNELRNRNEQLASLLQKFRAEKENLITNANALKGMWEGEANDSFNNAFLKDMGQVEAFIDLIENYIRVMENIADRYESAEAKNINIANTRIY